MHRRLAAIACSGALVLLTAAPAAAATVGAGATRPVAALARTDLTVGGTVAVLGRGWPAGAVVQAELCGGDGIDPGSQCAAGSLTTATPTAAGTFLTVLPVADPPVPCPCVVLVRSAATSGLAAIAVTVAGAPGPPAPSGAAPTPAPPVRLAITGRVTGGASLASLFGAPSSKTAVITVSDPGPTAAPGSSLSAWFGRGSHPSGAPRTLRLPALSPGESLQVRLPLDLGAFAHGSDTVTASVDGGARWSATTTTEPWGLYVVVVLVIVAALVRLIVWLRRRRRGRDEQFIDLRAAIDPRPSRPAPAQRVLVGAVAGQNGTPPPNDVVATLSSGPVAVVNEAGSGRAEASQPSEIGGAAGPGSEEVGDEPQPGSEEVVAEPQPGSEEVVDEPQSGSEDVVGGPVAGTGGDEEDGDMSENGWEEQDSDQRTDPEPGAAGFEPGEELTRALEGVSAAIRAEAGRVMAERADAARRETEEMVATARRESDVIMERAAHLQETAAAAIEKAGHRYESVLRILGQLTGSLSELRDQANAEYEALRRVHAEIPVLPNDLHEGDGEHTEDHS